MSSIFSAGVRDLWQPVGGVIGGSGTGGVSRRRAGRKTRTSLTKAGNLPKLVGKKLGEAELHYINGDYPQAVILLTELCELAPKLPDAYNLLALINEANGDKERALHFYHLAAGLYKKNMALWEKVMDLAYTLEHWDIAYNTVTRFLRRDPHSVPLQMKRIHCCVQQNRIEIARSSFQQLMRAENSSINVQLEYGDMLLQAGFEDFALDNFLQFVFYFLGTRRCRPETLQLYPETAALLPNAAGVLPRPEVLDHLGDLFYAAHQALETILTISEVTYRAAVEAAAVNNARSALRMGGGKAELLVLSGVDLVEQINDYMQLVRASLPPDAPENDASLLETPMNIAMMYALCKLRLRDEFEVDAALTILRPIFASMDAEELLSQFLTPSLHHQLVTIETMNTDDIDNAIDLLKQLIRTARELEVVGVHSRSERMLQFITSALNGVQHCITASFDVGVQKDKRQHALSSMWNDVGEALSEAATPQTDSSLRAYAAALELNPDNLCALYRYSNLLRQARLVETTEGASFTSIIGSSSSIIGDSARSSGESDLYALELLNRHFEMRIREFESEKNRLTQTKSKRVAFDAHVTHVAISATDATSATGVTDVTEVSAAAVPLSAAVVSTEETKFQTDDNEKSLSYIGGISSTAMNVDVPNTDSSNTSRRFLVVARSSSDKVIPPGVRFADEDDDKDVIDKDASNGSDNNALAGGDDEDAEGDEDDIVGESDNCNSDDSDSADENDKCSEKDDNLLVDSLHDYDRLHVAVATEAGVPPPLKGNTSATILKKRQNQSIARTVSHRAGRQSTHFSHHDLRYTVLNLMEWAYLHLKNQNKLRFCSIMLPILEAWCGTVISATCETLSESADANANAATATSLDTTTNTSVVGATGQSKQQQYNYASSTSTRCTGKKYRNRLRAVINMYGIAVSTAAKNFAPKEWLPTELNDVAHFVYAICSNISIQYVFGNEVLEHSVTLVAQILDAEVPESSQRCVSLGEKLKTCSQKRLFGVSNERRPKSATRKRKYSRLDESKEGDTIQRSTGKGTDDVDETGYSSDRNSSSDSSDQSDDSDGDGIDAASRSAVFKKILLARNSGSNSSIRNIQVSSSLIAWNRFRKVQTVEDDPLLLDAKRISSNAYLSVQQLLREPTDYSAANRLYEYIMLQSDVYSSKCSPELQLPLKRLQQHQPNNCVSALLAAHDFAHEKKHGLALENYLNAFVCDDRQPLIALCIGAYILMLCNHALTKQRPETCVKGLAFLHRYIRLRRDALATSAVEVAADVTRLPYEPTTSPQHQQQWNVAARRNDHDILELCVYQETLYNLGRAFHDIRLYDVAAAQYERSLRLADAFPALCCTSSSRCVSVTREAAHNLVLIYKRSESLDLALEIMQKYLTID